MIYKKKNENEKMKKKEKKKRVSGSGSLGITEIVIVCILNTWRECHICSLSFNYPFSIEHFA
jgi:hypothetical protein